MYRVTKPMTSLVCELILTVMKKCILWIAQMHLLENLFKKSKALNIFFKFFVYNQLLVSGHET